MARSESRRASARCVICHGVQHVRKDGTFGKHHIWSGNEYRGICPGAGRVPAEVEQREAEIWSNFVNG
jgi:hypothetical protein